jgi:hypothetical protein
MIASLKKFSSDTCLYFCSIASCALAASACASSFILLNLFFSISLVSAPLLGANKSAVTPPTIAPTSIPRKNPPTEDPQEEFASPPISTTSIFEYRCNPVKPSDYISQKTNIAFNSFKDLCCLPDESPEPEISYE